MPLSHLRLARYGGALILGVFAAAYFVWLPFRPIGTPMTDFSAYYSAGRYWSMGGNPYGRGIWSVEKTLPGADPARDELLPYVGPPLSLPLWAALGKLSYVAAAVVWGIVLVACAIVLIVVPVRLAKRRIAGGTAASLLLLTLVAGPIVTGISVGQAALPAAAAVALALAFAGARRWWLMALATTAAALLKPNDALVVLGAVQQLPALLAVAGSAVISTLGNVPLAGGIQGLIGYLAVLAQQGASEHLFTYQMTVTSIAFGLGLDPTRATVLGTGVSLAAIAVIVVAIRATHATAVDAGAIGCALFPFVVPFEHEPDLAIVFLPALLVVLRAHGRTWILGAIGAVLLCVDAFAMAQGALGLLFTLVTAVVACLQVAALAPAGAGRARLAPLGVVPLILFLGLFAPPRNLPMWPAALPEHVVAPHASAAAEWYDELAASGLETQRPWASCLRLLTLSACGGIGAAMIRTAAGSREHAGQMNLQTDAQRTLPAVQPENAAQTTRFSV